MNDQWPDWPPAADTQSLCWCGRPRVEHDGREMDPDGNMHRFGEVLQAVESRGTRLFDPLDLPGSESDSPVSRPRYQLGTPGNVLALLRETLRLLERGVVRPADNGQKTFHPHVLDQCRSLAVRLREFLGEDAGLDPPPPTAGSTPVKAVDSSKQRGLLVDLHDKLGELGDNWSAGKPVKANIKEVRALRARIDQVLG